MLLFIITFCSKLFRLPISFSAYVAHFYCLLYIVEYCNCKQQEAMPFRQARAENATESTDLRVDGCGSRRQPLRLVVKFVQRVSGSHFDILAIRRLSCSVQVNLTRSVKTQQSPVPRSTHQPNCCGGCKNDVRFTTYWKPIWLLKFAVNTVTRQSTVHSVIDHFPLISEHWAALPAAVTINSTFCIIKKVAITAALPLEVARPASRSRL